MNDSVRGFLELVIFETDKFRLEVVDIISVILIFLGARLIIWLFKKYFHRKKGEGKFDTGKTYAYTQLVSYVIYVVAIVLIIENLGFSITVLLAGSTALLVGLGLGLQDFFRDLVRVLLYLLKERLLRET